jgi:hypothetical protein
MAFLVRCVRAVTLVALPTVAAAQSAPSSQPQQTPLWATLSLGRGDLQVNCGICRRNDQTSWTADLGLGGWLNPRTNFGGELGAWRLGGDDATQRVMMMSAISQLYPVGNVPAFLKLGVGLMNYRSTDGEQSLSACSLGLNVGFGYEIPFRERYVIVPNAGLVHGFNNGLYLDGSKVTGMSQVKLLRFGVGVGVRR